MAWYQFAETLRRLRTEMGHTSARSFYKSQGGQKFFGCTYRQYLNVENGESAPSPRLVERIVLALNVPSEEERAWEFFISYIDALLGREKLLKMLLQGLDRKAGQRAPEVPLQKAMVRHFESRSIPLTMRQADALYESYENYWVWMLLSSDRGRWSAAKLAASTGLKQPQVTKSLKALVKAGLIRKEKSGDFHCPNAGKVFNLPRGDVFKPKLAKLRGYWERMQEAKGERIMCHHMLTRASEHELRTYCPQLIKAVQASDICSVDRKGDDTALFAIETTVRKLLPF